MIALALFALLVSFLFLFVLLPRVIFPIRTIPGTFLDRSVAGFVAITALTVAAMYAFVLVNMMEIIAFAAVWFAAWWVLKGRHQESGRLSRAAYSIFSFFDVAEAKGTRTAASDAGNEARGRAGRRMRGTIGRARDAVTDPGTLLTLGALLLILGVSAWLRFERAVMHAELVPQDSYLALFATKNITAGGLHMFTEGIYPQGAYLWMSLFNRFYPLDAYTFVRFAGPLMATLELVALYWAVSRATRSRAGGVLATAIFGLFAGHPALFVVWDRQIGSMTQEFAVAFALVSMVFGASYMARRQNHDLWLAGGALFMAVTSHTIALILCALGFGAILIAGFITASWTADTLKRIVAVGIAATAAGHAFVLIGLLRGQSFARSYLQYDPRNTAGFGGAAESLPGEIGASITGNFVFQLGFLGCVIAIVVGVLLALRSNPSGRILLAFAGGILAFLLFHDFVAQRFEFLFRARVAFVTGHLMVAGIGLGLGAVMLAAADLAEVRDPLWNRLEGSRRYVGAGLQIAALLAAVIMVAAMWPMQSVVARVAARSGYPQATQVALDIIEEEPRLTYTFVGASEQYQEGYQNGFHVEAWVFAKEIEFADARDPSYEIPIPTDTIYVFAEKEAFDGPQAPWTGATEEYYRTTEKRRRIMQRIIAWMEEYQRFHQGVDVYYENDELRVYKVERNVDLERAKRSNQFGPDEYEYRQGDYFDDDADITSNTVDPNPDAPNERQDERGNI